MPTSQTFVAEAADDRLQQEVPDTDEQLGRVVISYAGSLLINGLVIFLMTYVSTMYPVEMKTVEIPVEIVAASPEPPPTPPPKVQNPLAAQPPPSAATKSPSRQGGFGARDPAEEERQQKAELGKIPHDGDGTASSPTVAPRSVSAEQDREEIDPDPRKEISRLVPAPQGPRAKKKRVAPPGLDGKAVAREKPKTETADATTIRREPLHCGENARNPVKSQGRLAFAVVLGEATSEQAAQMIQRTQATLDMSISPDYLSQVRVFIHFDWTPEGAWAAALLPPGLSVQRGDRVEILGHHLDPERSCHYIPAFVRRVL